MKRVFSLYVCVYGDKNINRAHFKCTILTLNKNYSYIDIFCMCGVLRSFLWSFLALF